MRASSAEWFGRLVALALAAGSVIPSAAFAQDPADFAKLMERVEALERQNRELREQIGRPRPPDDPGETSGLQEEIGRLRARLDSLESQARTPQPPAPDPTEAPAPEESGETAAGPGPTPDRPSSDDDAPPAVREYEVGKDLAFSEMFWENGLRFQTPDRAFQFHLGGRADFDSTWYQQDPNLVFGNSDRIRLRDGADFRRLRLRAEGRMWETVDYAFEVNFANIQDFGNVDQSQEVGSVGLTDVWLQWPNLPVAGSVRVGHFQPPISLEHFTSTNVWYYMERSPMFDAFINRFDYVDGFLMYRSYLDQRATVAWSLMRTGSTTVSPFGSGSGDGEYGAAVRGTLLPVYKDEGRRLLHLGLGYLVRALDEDATSPGARPLVRAGAGNIEVPNVIQNGSVFSPVSFHYLDAEVAAVFGRLAVSSEYLFVYNPGVFASRPNRNAFLDPRGPLFDHGFYVEAGYFLTRGDYRRYDRRFGVWDRTVPQENSFLVRDGRGRLAAGRGAVQVLARYTYLDLISGNPPISPTQGARAGQENDLTLGLNWYLNPQTFIMINYVHTWVDSIVPAHTGAFQGLGLRFHYDF